jgi:hypothetical protein
MPNQDNTEIEVYKGATFLSKTYSSKKSPIVITFDLDETLGSFSDLEILWSAIKKYNNTGHSHSELVHSDFFNTLLDLYPEFLRYGILSILEFLYAKKKRGHCDKIYIYTNNQCSQDWCYMIARYFDYKLKTDSELFDQMVCAFKINNKIIEIGRTTNNKTYQDFIKCTLLPKKTKLCFVDNTYFPDMINDRVYYIQPMSYLHHLTTSTVVDRFLTSPLCGTVITQSQHFLFADFLYKQFYRQRSYSPANKQALEMDIFVAQKMMYYIKEFFYLSTKKMRTRKINYRSGRFTRKKCR